jgi:RecB family exonuclease
MTWDTIWDETFLETIAEVEGRFDSNPTDWRSGGRASVKNPDKENKVWWDENGKRMFFDFITAWEESKLTTWVSPTGVPGIEIEFNAYFGDVMIKAFADSIAVTPDGQVAVIDFKTGSRTPDSAMQLGVYASLMELQFGIRPTLGYYYDARTATFKESPGLERWTIPVLTELFMQFDKGEKAGIYLPNIGMACSTCGVKEYCYAVGGQLSKIYDPLATIGEK